MSTNTAKKTERKLEVVPENASVNIDTRPATKDDALVVVMVGGAIAAVVGALSYLGWKADKAKQTKLNAEHAVRLAEAEAKAAEMQAWFEDVRRNGKIVVETLGGEYMAIPAEAYAASEIMKKNF